MIGHRIARGLERARTTPGLGRDLIAIALLITMGVVVASGILSKQHVHWPWQSERVFMADFRQAPGISPGNGQEVRISGVTVGRITKADVTTDGDARLTLAIEPKYQVYKNAVLVLRPKTPLNDMYVEMNPGTPSSGVLPKDAVLPIQQTRNPVEVDEVLQHLDDRTRTALATLLDESDAALASAPENLPAGLDSTNQVLRTLQPVAQSLATRNRTIAALVTAFRQITTAAGGDDARLRRLLGSMATTVTTLAAHDDDVRAALRQLPGTTTQLARATSSVNGLSKQLNPTLKNIKAASSTLPDALSDLGTLAGQLDSTAIKARPVVAELRPVIADLRPFIGALRPTLSDVVPVADRLDFGTQMLVQRLADIQAFVYNTTSIVSLQDANGGILRGQADINASSLGIPTGGTN